MALIARSTHNTARCSTPSLLAAVYVELVSERQAALQLESITAGSSNVRALVRARPYPLPPRVTADDRTGHREFVRTLGSEAVWLDYPESGRPPRLPVAARRSGA